MAIDGLPPGPYEVRAGMKEGAAWTVWGKQGTPPDFSDGWATPIVAFGVQSCMVAIAEMLNAGLSKKGTPNAWYREGWEMGHRAGLAEALRTGATPESEG